MSQVVVVSGLSGAGRSVAAGAFEDLGWFVIDNLPGALVPKVGELALSAGGAYDRVALVMGGYDEEVSTEIEALRRQIIDVRAVFLEASTEVLVRRYQATRRRHPRAEEGDLVQAVESERRILAKARLAADLVIDTTDLNPHQLRERIQAHFSDEPDDAGPHLSLVTFGFKHGLPLDADLVFDCRFLPNPYWEPDLRDLRGTDPAVQDFVMAQPSAQQFVADVEQLLVPLIPEFEAEGKRYLTVAVGCTGGHHRSVSVAERLAVALRNRGLDPKLHHRDLAR
jgi:UPF0042 nucleotide-binding protein